MKKLCLALFVMLAGVPSAQGLSLFRRSAPKVQKLLFFNYTGYPMGAFLVDAKKSGEVTIGSLLDNINGSVKLQGRTLNIAPEGSAYYLLAYSGDTAALSGVRTFNNLIDVLRREPFMALIPIGSPNADGLIIIRASTEQLKPVLERATQLTTDESKLFNDWKRFTRPSGF